MNQSEPQLPLNYPRPQPQAPVAPTPKKKGKKGLLLILIILIVAGGIGFFLWQKNNDKKVPKPSNSNEENVTSNQNQVKSDKIAMIAEDATVLKSYGEYFEIEKDGKYSVIDTKGNTVLENPLYLSSAISDGKVIYQGKPLAVSGTFDKYKIYYSTDNPELGYVAVFNSILNLESNKVQDFYIGNDIVITIYWNQQTEENFLVKYNIKTGTVLTEKIIDGYLDFFTWNGKNYLAESHNNLVDVETLNLVFKQNYLLGDGPYADDHSKVVSSSNRYLTASLNGKYGIIDGSENVVIPFNYLSLKQVNDNVIIAQTKDGYGLINYKNEKVLNFVYDKIDVYENSIVTIDHNGILKILNHQYEPLFTGSRKILLANEKGTYSYENIIQKRNVYAYYHMASGLEEGTYFAIVDVNSGKSKELVEYTSYEKVNRSPSGYGYVVFMSNENFSVYDGIGEIAKANVLDFGFTSAKNFYYVGNDYITFEATKEGEVNPKQYFLNMKKNIIEQMEDTNLKEEEVLTYDELFDNGYFLKYENDKINIYDGSNNLLGSILGETIEPLEGFKNYYQIKNKNKVTIIRINEK